MWSRTIFTFLYIICSFRFKYSGVVGGRPINNLCAAKDLKEPPNRTPVDDQRGTLMSRNAVNQMNADLNKRDKVSPRPSRKLHHHFWQEIRRTKVIKCPSDSSPKGYINSNTNNNLKHSPNTNA